MEIKLLHKNENSVSTHNIYLADYTFNNILSKEENNLLETNELYAKSFNICSKSIKSKLYNKIFPEDFAGVVKYIPITGNIKESANIILYVVNGTRVNKNSYDSAISILKKFISKNKLKNIRLNGSDVYHINSIDLIMDLSNCESLEVIEVTE